MTQSSKITGAEGHGIVVRGDDIDTDRIIPARFLKTITFEGLEQHLFEDDRQQLAERGTVHAIDRPDYQGAAIMFVGSNFGCGSSREHAPQAIARWGIMAVVGVSFAEIFFGNSLMIGLPCATVTPEQSEQLTAAIEADPSVTCRVDLPAKTISVGKMSVPLGMPESVRSSLMSGNWDATGLLVEHYEAVERIAASLPYVAGWARF
jgi:3-isopropylmalate/(R)-2-methylmalate dehydratase small subunit